MVALKDSKEIGDAIAAFQALGVCNHLSEAAARLGWKRPTSIQEQAIPHLLQGRAARILQERFTVDCRCCCFLTSCLQTGRLLLVANVCKIAEGRQALAGVWHTERAVSLQGKMSSGLQRRDPGRQEHLPYPSFRYVCTVNAQAYCHCASIPAEVRLSFAGSPGQPARFLCVGPITDKRAGCPDSRKL